MYPLYSVNMYLGTHRVHFLSWFFPQFQSWVSRFEIQSKIQKTLDWILHFTNLAKTETNVLQTMGKLKGFGPGTVKIFNFKPFFFKLTGVLGSGRIYSLHFTLHFTQMKWNGHRKLDVKASTHRTKHGHLKQIFFTFFKLLFCFNKSDIILNK